MRQERRLAAILCADVVGYSRMMERDEDGIIARQKSLHREVLDPNIRRCHGRIVKTTGDGLLAEFSTAQDAVRCAIDFQNEIQAQEADRSASDRFQYRVGINVGDIVYDDGDVMGDGVNVAARLESIAKPGGICISDPVNQIVQDRLREVFQDLGTQKVKNIERPIRVWQWTPDLPAQRLEPAGANPNQRVEFGTAPDGAQLAYASVGDGAPVFKAPNWLNHLDYEWRSPVWGPVLSRIATSHRLVRFDQRGNGLSDWDAVEISADAMIGDMEAVVAAAGLDRFAVFGISQGCAFSIRYAAKNPEKVRCLVLLGGFLRGTLTGNSPEQKQLYEAAVTMIRLGWGSPNPVYRHFFTERFMPDATAEQKSSFDELQRIATSPEIAVRIYAMIESMDVTAYARAIKAPTLVLHAEGDRDVPIEDGRRMAAAIPGSHFVALPGNNHVLIEGTPAFEIFFREFDDFVNRHGG